MLLLLLLIIIIIAVGPMSLASLLTLQSLLKGLGAAGDHICRGDGARAIGATLNRANRNGQAIVEGLFVAQGKGGVRLMIRKEEDKEILNG